MPRKDYYEYYGVKSPLIETISVPDVIPFEHADASQAILQSIYALDPVTKLPTGDIMCYMSSQTPPEIKKYILDNLMSDTSSAALPPLPEGIDQDTAFALERKYVNGKIEDLNSYRERINAYMKHQVDVRNMAIANAKSSHTSQLSKE